MEIAIIILIIATIGLVIAVYIVNRKRKEYRDKYQAKVMVEELRVDTLTRTIKMPTRPLIVDWLYSGTEYFKKSEVSNMTMNPNGTMNVMLRNGHTINTGLKIKEAKQLLDITYDESVESELKYKQHLWHEDRT